MGDRSALPPSAGSTMDASPGSGPGSAVSAAAAAVPGSSRAPLVPSPAKGTSRPQPSSQPAPQPPLSSSSSSTSLTTPPPPPSTATSAAASSTSTPSRKRRSAFLSRLVHLPLRAVSSATTPTVRSVADFHIRPAEPHRKYNAGDHVLGAVVLAVVKPLCITHLTVSLRGLVRVFKDPGAAAGPLPADVVAAGGVAVMSSSGRGGAFSGSRRAKAAARAAEADASASKTTAANATTAHHCLFRDEMVLCGAGWLQPGNYEFQFDLLFPDDGCLPSSIEFERGSIAYVVTATLTRPVTVAPVLSCDRRIFLVDPIDVGTVPRPLPRTISLEPISRRSRRRTLVVATTAAAAAAAAVAQQQPPRPTTTASGAAAAGTPPIGSVSDGLAGPLGGSGSGSCGGNGNGGCAGDDDGASVAVHHHHYQVHYPQAPRSPVLPSDLCSTFSVDSAGSGGSRSRGSSSAATTAGVRPALVLGLPPTSLPPQQTSAIDSNAPNAISVASTGTAPAGSPKPTITATIETLKGGCLPGDTVGVRIAVQHVKRIKSLHGVIVTLFRQGRIDSAPPAMLMQLHTGTRARLSGDGSVVQAPEEQPGRENNNGGTGVAQDAAAGDQQSGPSSAAAASSQTLAGAEEENGSAAGNAKKTKKKTKKDKGRASSEKEDAGAAAYDFYPKSKTGLAGLSLTSAGSCSVFRKDLSQSFSPLIIDPRTLQSSVTASVRVPEDAFATIRGVPGDMIRFTYQLEVIVDLGGKLASLLQGGGGDSERSGEGGGGQTANTAAAAAANPSDILGGGLLPGVDVGGRHPYDTATLPTLLRGRHMVDTDLLRRQKGVVSVVFEVVVGTTDSSRRRGRWPQQQQQQLQTQPRWTEDDGGTQPSSSHPPYPPYTPYPPTWYPEDTKGSPSTRQQQQEHEQLPPPHWLDVASSSTAGAPATATTPLYAPTPAMEAAAARADADLSEKERIRRAELRLLPSQPPAIAAEAGVEEGLGTPGPSGPGGNGPTAPMPELLDNSGPPSAPAALPPFDGASFPSSSTAAAEDKQELERRRLLAEASAPPSFPDEEGDLGDIYSAGGGAGSADPSAPVLDEDDELGLTATAPSADSANEDHYGRQYTYGPGAAPTTEPLPRYER